MSDYQLIQNKAGELYKLLDQLAEVRNEQHREASALALINAKLQIQKLLGVPPQIDAIPVVEVVPSVTIVPVPEPKLEFGYVTATVEASKPAPKRGRK